ncbi:MAG: zinc-dependent peptidase [Kiritimatiellae bacterium]|jgi:Mlc titration factor MtfA (ptsG expression regulator)|nr:zinc-dependent peptidase [Kiritimatiellia bacterium]
MSIFHPFRDRRRKALDLMPFPKEWFSIIDKNVPFFKELDAAEREHLEDLIKVFINEKNFEGCGGLEITDEIKVTVAAQACLLLLNLENNYYDQLVSILVYPSGINHKGMSRNNNGLITEEEVPVSGLSSSGGVIVLSWTDTIGGSKNTEDGNNVVFHEFAHQLDLLSGAVNGAPVLSSISEYRDWGRILTKEYKKLQTDVSKHRKSVIRPYGATAPAEFFAVVTEIFFEKPHQLKEDHPELYEEFKAYYHQNPAERT